MVRRLGLHASPEADPSGDVVAQSRRSLPRDAEDRAEIEDSAWRSDVHRASGRVNRTGGMAAFMLPLAACALGTIAAAVAIKLFVTYCL